MSDLIRVKTKETVAYISYANDELEIRSHNPKIITLIDALLKLNGQKTSSHTLVLKEDKNYKKYKLTKLDYDLLIECLPAHNLIIYDR